MSLLICFLLAFSLLGSASGDTLTLPTGTSIGASSFVKLNTGKLKPGDRVNLEVKFNVEIDDLVIVKAGTPLIVEVEAVDSPRRYDIVFRPIQTTAVDGTRVGLTGSMLLARSGIVTGVMDGIIESDPKATRAVVRGGKRSSFWYDTILTGMTAGPIAFSRDAIVSNQPSPKCGSSFGTLSLVNNGSITRILLVDGQPAVTIPPRKYTSLIFVPPGRHTAGLQDHVESLPFTVNRCRVVYLKIDDAGIVSSNGVSMYEAMEKLESLNQCDISPGFWGSGPVAGKVLPKVCAKSR
jgi:hypothetical protein